MIFFCQEIFFSFKFTFFRTKDTRTRKRSFTFFLVFIFSFFSFFGSLHLSFFGLSFYRNRSPDRKVYVFWKEAITADLASSDSASFFEILYQGTSSVFNYGQSCQKCTTKKHLDISNADEASTGWVGIKAEL